MNKVVLDASAVLALLNQETGYNIVEQYLPDSIISAVNLLEVITVLSDIGMPSTDARNIIAGLVKNIIVFDEQQACIAADLRKTTKSYGLSLGDRACLALAEVSRLPVLTADKIWTTISDCSVKIICIR